MKLGIDQLKRKGYGAIIVAVAGLALSACSNEHAAAGTSPAETAPSIPPASAPQTIGAKPSVVTPTESESAPNINDVEAGDVYEQVGVTIADSLDKVSSDKNAEKTVEITENPEVPGRFSCSITAHGEAYSAGFEYDKVPNIQGAQDKKIAICEKGELMSFTFRKVDGGQLLIGRTDGGFDIIMTDAQGKVVKSANTKEGKAATVALADAKKFINKATA